MMPIWILLHVDDCRKCLPLESNQLPLLLYRRNAPFSFHFFVSPPVFPHVARHQPSLLRRPQPFVALFIAYVNRSSLVSFVSV